MKTLSGTVGLKLMIVAASAIASIVLISAFGQPPQPTCPPDVNAPVLIIMDKDGLKSTKSGDALKAVFDELIRKCGDKVCNVDYYDRDHPLQGNPAWHRGYRKLVPTAAVRSEASRNLASADPAHIVQQAAFETTDDAISFLTNIK